MAGRSVKPKENVGRDKAPEEHDFRREEQPDPDLCVPKTGIGPGGDCVRNFHGCLVNARRGGSFVGFAVALGQWLALHGEILFAAGQAVFVRPAVNARGDREVSLRRWRRRGPFQGRRLPRIVVDLYAAPEAPEEIEDEWKLREA